MLAGLGHELLPLAWQSLGKKKGQKKVVLPPSPWWEGVSVLKLRLRFHVLLSHPEGFGGFLVEMGIKIAV